MPGDASVQSKCGPIVLLLHRFDWNAPAVPRGFRPLSVTPARRRASKSLQPLQCRVGKMQHFSSRDVGI
jgi:hypothetical protein